MLWLGNCNHSVPQHYSFDDINTMPSTTLLSAHSRVVKGIVFMCAGAGEARATPKGLFQYHPQDTVKSSQYWFHVDHLENWILQYKKEFETKTLRNKSKTSKKAFANFMRNLAKLVFAKPCETRFAKIVETLQNTDCENCKSSEKGVALRS